MTKIFSFNDIPEFSKKERIVVVGIIGKSPYRYPNKTTPLLSNVQFKENDIECHWDERKSILYLHAVTYLDTRRLAQLAADLSEDSKSTVKDADAADWLVASGELAIDSCKIMALIFQLCHIVVLSSPTPVFDLGYLQLFKAIDAYRIETASQTSEALLSSGAGGAWETHGRSCCPRLLFHFRRAPKPLRRDPVALKKLEHAVEDQIYFILRKSRIITNVCAKTLFAIPKNEEFVYISPTEDFGRDASALLRALVQRCGPPPPDDDGAPQGSFGEFLERHLDRAFAEGFDDNVGKYALSTSFFELPSARSWRSAARALAAGAAERGGSGGAQRGGSGGAQRGGSGGAQRGGSGGAQRGGSGGAQRGGSGGALFDALATDVRFSQARCAKVLPIAQASYSEGLPPHYSSQHHAHKVGVALGVVEAMARGPLAPSARARLRDACAATWRSRALCEAPSLTGHPCIQPQHDAAKEHSSGVRYVSACACGRSKSPRDDPYSVLRANHGFYELAAADCGVCDTLQAVRFPVFQPSTPSRAAAVEGSEEAGDAAEGEAAAEAPEEPAPGSAADDERAPARSDVGDEPPPAREPSASAAERPTATECLAGMLHTASPAGLLPAFPSWSLLCLGASSLYSHSAGLPEHLQPGFLPHTNFLLPWDCPVRGDAARARARPKPAHPLTVKIFIGFEYECPRGHRFMMASPDAVVNGGGGAWGREAGQAGARLAAADMPLHAACPCRAHVLAQLTRLHVVTPKASALVTLDPRVRPAPGAPVFVPQPRDAPRARLSPSAYWVLRLPFVYADERGPLPRPHAPPRPPGALLAPVFGLHE